jgi:nucleoside-diphosphate-sugar epimerase
VRRTIIVSSMSAYAGTRQIYGRAKLASEADAFARGMCAVRLGLVYGPGWGGIAGMLRKLTSLPLVPVVGRHAHQFTLHQEDLGRAIVTVVKADALPSRPLGLAHADPVPFEELLRSIARVNYGREPRLLPIPWPLPYWAIRAVECASFRLPVRADSILGLVRPARSVPNSGDLQALGIELRPFSL